MAMDVHKLEIELTDELMAAIDRLSAERRSSRSDVVVATLKDHLPFTEKSDEISVEQRLAAIDRAFKIADSLDISRSQEDIDRQVRDSRADRIYDR